MRVQQDKYDVGVIVGRFQLHELHDAHKELIQHVVDRHSRVLMVLGTSPLKGTTRNPLDYAARRQLIQESFPDLEFFYIEDVWNDEIWSKKLDKLVRAQLTPSQTACLYGARDSFLDRYKGTLPSTKLESDTIISGEEIRRTIASSATIGSPDFRAGAIWQAHNRFPTAFQCVDILCFRTDEPKVLLGRKHDETQFRIIGGFVDPNLDASVEAAGCRELREEALDGECTWPEIVPCPREGTRIVDDWRYRQERDKILTHLLVCEYLHGAIRPADDIAEVKWQMWLPEYLNYNQIVKNHRNLLKEGIHYWRRKVDANYAKATQR